MPTRSIKGARKAKVTRALNKKSTKSVSLADVSHVNFFVGGKFKRFALDGKAKTMNNIVDHINKVGKGRDFTILTIKKKGGGRAAHVYDVNELKKAVNLHLEMETDRFFAEHLKSIHAGKAPKLSNYVDLNDVVANLSTVQKGRYKHKAPKQTVSKKDRFLSKKVIVDEIERIHNHRARRFAIVH